jgi:hypothetical protein
MSVKNLSTRQINQEFERQVENLLKKEYPKLNELNDKVFLNHVLPLKEKLIGLTLFEPDFEKGYLPFVVIIQGDFNREKAMMLVEKEGKNGVTILRPLSTSNFAPIDDVTLPDSLAYLLINIDRGKENINLPPKEAFEIIKKGKRSPLTIDEGIAIITHFPDFLIKNNCFSLLASRTGLDQRVPAIWINSKKQPNLGWCWNGNPHTWLGSASAEKRIGS